MPSHAGATAGPTSRPSPSAGSEKSRSSRVSIFDIVRGFSVISMVGFHLCYDLKFIEGMPLAWFAPPFQDVWRASISWTFLFIAGCMCSFSRDNLRRSAKYLAVALLIYIATALAGVDTPISFGIIFCMGASTLVAGLLERLGIRPEGLGPALVFLVLFLLTLGVPDGLVGIGGWHIDLPRALYQVPGLAWLGLPDASFVSGDYYPMIPFTLMYFCGVSLGWHWRQTGYPAWCSDAHVRLLEFVGRHALAVYILHQPVLLLLTGGF